MDFRSFSARFARRSAWSSRYRSVSRSSAPARSWVRRLACSRSRPLTSATRPSTFKSSVFVDSGGWAGGAGGVGRPDAVGMGRRRFRSSIAGLGIGGEGSGVGVAGAGSSMTSGSETGVGMGTCGAGGRRACGSSSTRTSSSSTSHGGPPTSNDGASTMGSSSSTSLRMRDHFGAVVTTRAGMTSPTVIRVRRSSAGLVVTSARRTVAVTAGVLVFGKSTSSALLPLTIATLVKMTSPTAYAASASPAARRLSVTSTRFVSASYQPVILCPAVTIRSIGTSSTVSSSAIAAGSMLPTSTRARPAMTILTGPLTCRSSRVGSC